MRLVCLFVCFFGLFLYFGFVLIFDVTKLLYPPVFSGSFVRQGFYNSRHIIPTKNTTGSQLGGLGGVTTLYILSIDHSVLLPLIQALLSQKVCEEKPTGFDQVLSWEKDLTLGDFTLKSAKLEGKSVSMWLEIH